MGNLSGDHHTVTQQIFSCQAVMSDRTRCASDHHKIYFSQRCRSRTCDSGVTAQGKEKQRWRGSEAKSRPRAPPDANNTILIARS